MILFGVALINKIDWIIYVFGVFLLYTAFRMLKADTHEFNPKESFVFRQISKVFPITSTMDGNHFFIRRLGIRAATPLFVALVIIELTDILFALDSIPAILAITADPFIVFTSNILAILGLRSMYFLVVILSFVGIKMLLSHHVHMPEWVSLSVIALSLIGGILASLYIPEKNGHLPSQEDILDESD